MEDITRRILEEGEKLLEFVKQRFLQIVENKIVESLSNRKFPTTRFKLFSV